jgi:hypothetical protein
VRQLGGQHEGDGAVAGRVRCAGRGLRLGIRVGRSHGGRIARGRCDVPGAVDATAAGREPSVGTRNSPG